jgi:hypothetical protein
MAWKQVLEMFEMLDSAHVDGERVAGEFRRVRLEEITTTRVHGDSGYTDFVKVLIPGSNGATAGGEAPTLGIIGRHGGLGARPERIGFVSDGDGPLVALSAAMKLGAMKANGDDLPGDVIVATHVCPTAPTRPHHPVAFMGAPVRGGEMNRHELDDRMDAILSVDTTKGNRVINHRGFAISPTVKQGYILRISESLLEIMQQTTGRFPVVFPITTQDITPYGNDLFHLNSILQPATGTSSPVVGVAITAEVAVPGSATGATQLTDVESATRFCIEVAKAFGAGECKFHDQDEFRNLIQRYGEMTHLQTLGT